MSAPDATDLELMRLARLLKVEPEQLDGLRPLPIADLKVLRDQVAARLFDEGKDSFHRAATVANVVPAGLAAKLAEHALGPVLAARTTAVTEPKKSVELAAKFHTAFLADVSQEIDPRAVTDLVEAMPPKIIAEIGNELASRGEWLVMADFVGAISHDAMRTTINALSAASVLHVAELLEDRSRLDEIVAMLPDQRLDEIVAVAEAEGLHDQLGSLVDGLSDEQRARIRD